MLKSRTKWPNGGWQFFQAQTGWKLPAGQDFHQAVLSIIAHRKANPRFKLSTDYDAVANELDAFQCARLGNDPAWCVSENIANFSNRLPSRVQPAGVRASAVGANKFLKNATVGIKTYLEWFGDGKPETIPVAEARAEICLKCPHNKKGGLLERFTQAAANEIMSVMGVLKDLNLHTSREAELHVCELCNCPLSAKVFAPLNIVRKHIRPETMASLPDFCWIRREP